MSETEQDVEQFLREQVFSGKPASPSEAVAAAEEIPVEEAPPEDAPITVTDEPTPPSPPPPETPPEPPAPETPTEETPEEEPDEFGGNEHVVWAKKKYGDRPELWAKAAFDQEQHISRVSREKNEVEQTAQQWYEYAQQLEQGQQTAQGAMPLSAGEEQWVENSLVNPLEYARQAAFQGKVGLYNAVIERISMENPVAAGQIATAVQMELAEYAALEQASANGGGKPSFQEMLGGSFQRLGIDLQTHGPRMAEKIGELGEYNPLVQAILEGDDRERDLAVRAVYEMAPVTTTRRVGNDEAIRRENELRRDASVVQTGGIQPPPPPPGVPSIIEGMRQEWRERGQYRED